MSKQSKIAMLNSEIWVEGNNPKQYSIEEVFARVMLRVNNPDTITRIMVGTDSHSYGMSYHFVTVICAWDEGKGGTYYYSSALEPRKSFQGSQKMRLQDEVTKSLTIAFEIESKLNIKPEVHIDASPSSKKEFSSSFSDYLKGYVLSSGFEAILKPDSVVANAVADRHSRRRVRGRKEQTYE